MSDFKKAIQDLDELFQKSSSVGEYSYDDDEEVSKLCDPLQESKDYKEWLPLVFELIEKYDDTVDLTLGSPGPLVHLLESTFPNYDDELHESMLRKPTQVTLWMADRISRSPDIDQELWERRIKDAKSHPKLSDTIKRDLGLT